MTLENSLHVTLKNVLPVLGRIPVTELERRHVSELHYPMRRTATAATDAVNAPSRTFSRTDAWGTVPPGGNPCRGMRKHRTRRRGRFLTEHEFRRLGETLPAPEAEGRIGGDGGTASLDADWLPRRVHRAEVGGRVAGPERDSARQIEDVPAHEIVAAAGGSRAGPPAAPGGHSLGNRRREARRASTAIQPAPLPGKEARPA